MRERILDPVGEVRFRREFLGQQVDAAVVTAKGAQALEHVHFGLQVFQGTEELSLQLAVFQGEGGAFRQQPERVALVGVQRLVGAARHAQ